jgi:hypothetical protein
MVLAYSWHRIRRFFGAVDCFSCKLIGRFCGIMAQLPQASIAALTNSSRQEIFGMSKFFHYSCVHDHDGLVHTNQHCGRHNSRHLRYAYIPSA